MVAPVIAGVAIGLEELAVLLFATGTTAVYIDKTMKKSPSTTGSSLDIYSENSESTSSKSSDSSSSIMSETTQSDLFNYSNNATIDEIIERDLHTQSVGIEQEYSLISEGDKTRLRASALAKIAALSVATLNCSCPPDMFKRVRLKWFRRGMSLLSLDYQSAICDVDWTTELDNSKSRLIPEWEYFQGPGNPPVDFDGWLPKLCLFLEVKARYDFLFEKGTGTSVLHKWAKGYTKSLTSQAERQNTVCSFNMPAKCCWVWMTPKAYAYFQTIIRKYPYLLSVYVPLLN